MSMANFVSAAYGDPQSFRNVHCTNDRVLESCATYQTVDEAVFVYFFLGSATLGLCIVGFSYIVRIRHNDSHGSYDSITFDETPPDSTPRIGLELPGTSAGEASTALPVNDDDAEEEHMELSVNETADVWREIQGPAFCIFLVFTLTLSLFPSWTSQIKSAHQCTSSWRMANDLFTPMSFVIFNVGDLVGRLLSSRVSFSTSQRRSRDLVKAALTRFLFLVLLFFCPGGSRSTFRGSDVYTLVVLSAFSVSNGFLLSASFCHAPSLIGSIPKLQERMAEILNLSVSLGLLVGSLLSFPVAAFLSGE